MYSIAGIMILATVLTLVISLLRMRGVASSSNCPASTCGSSWWTFCIVGTYAVNNSARLRRGHDGALRDHRAAVPPVRALAGPVVLGLILGPLADGNFRRSMEIGGLETIYTSPIAVFLIVAAVLAWTVPRIRSMKARRGTGVRV